MKFDIKHLKDLANKLDYKPDSQQHIDNLSNYCSSDRVIAICEAYAALEARVKELYHAQEDRLFKIAQQIKGPAFDKYAHSPSQAIDVLEQALGCKPQRFVVKRPGTKCIGWVKETIHEHDEQWLAAIKAAGGEIAE